MKQLNALLRLRCGQAWKWELSFKDVLVDAGLHVIEWCALKNILGEWKMRSLTMWTSPTSDAHKLWYICLLRLLYVSMISVRISMCVNIYKEGGPKVGIHFAVIFTFSYIYLLQLQMSQWLSSHLHSSTSRFGSISHWTGFFKSISYTINYQVC